MLSVLLSSEVCLYQVVPATRVLRDLHTQAAYNQCWAVCSLLNMLAAAYQTAGSSAVR